MSESRSRAPLVLSATLLAALLGLVLWCGGLAGAAYFGLYLLALLPGLPIGWRLFGRGQPAGWIAGALIGYGLTALAFWLPIRVGAARPSSFLIVWLATGAVVWLLMRRDGEPLVSLPRFTRRDAAAGLLVMHLVVAFLALPFGRLGSVDASGTRYYRAYFTADFVWHAALTQELARFDSPPHNPFFARDPVHYYYTYFLVPAVLSGPTARAAGQRRDRARDQRHRRGDADVQPAVPRDVERHGALGRCGHGEHPRARGAKLRRPLRDRRLPAPRRPAVAADRRQYRRPHRLGLPRSPDRRPRPLDVVHAAAHHVVRAGPGRRHRLDSPGGPRAAARLPPHRGRARIVGDDEPAAGRGVLRHLRCDGAVRRRHTQAAPSGAARAAAHRRARAPWVVVVFRERHGRHGGIASQLRVAVRREELARAHAVSLARRPADSSGIRLRSLARPRLPAHRPGRGRRGRGPVPALPGVADGSVVGRLPRGQRPAGHVCRSSPHGALPACGTPDVAGSPQSASPSSCSPRRRRR